MDTLLSVYELICLLHTADRNNFNYLQMIHCTHLELSTCPTQRPKVNFVMQIKGIKLGVLTSQRLVPAIVQ